MSSFFVNRPIVAMVISIVMTIVGIITYLRLPVAQFPDIVPPEIQVKTTYTGADALTVEQSVATLHRHLEGLPVGVLAALRVEAPHPQGDEPVVCRHQYLRSIGWYRVCTTGL